MSRRIAAVAGVLAVGIGGGRALADAPVPVLGSTGPAPTAADPADAPAPAVDPCGAADGGTGGDENVDLTVDGYRRSFRIFVPGRPAGGRALPVLVALHGSKDTGAGIERYSGFSALARRDGFVAAYPNAIGGDWAIGDRGGRGAADVDLVGATIDYAETHYCVDPARVFAVGVSNGGGEASRVACGLASRVSGVAIVAGDYRRMPPCDPGRPVSIFDIHATSDPVVPYLGAPTTHDGSVPGYLAMWRSLDACRVPGTHRRVDANAVRARWTCADGTAVGQLKLRRGGHSWPGSDPRASTLPAPGSAGAEIWDFFEGLAARPS
ncbi:MAG TPA: PHB depolymerase family esterase [Solirubrobacteraceae bacterium]|nr:PHB depolymerase family esterase [Solirubrobacteraceae bacterium]